MSSNSRLRIVDAGEISVGKLTEGLEVLKFQGFEPEALRLVKCAHCSQCPEGAWGLYVTPEIEEGLEEGEPSGFCLECSSAIFIDLEGNINKQQLSATDVLSRAGIGKGK